MSAPASGATAVVIATRDRRERLLATLDRLRRLPERPAVVVVDNGSRDGTVEAVRERAPWARAIALERNLGAAARTVGARAVSAPFVAFCDDDSWWEPGALARAEDVLARHPEVGLVAARVLVGPQRRLDPVSRAMAESPLGPAAGLPWRRVLGFLACGAVVRRSAYLRVGGFEARFGIGGEEELLAIDLARAGWRLVYVPEVVAHHHPPPRRDPGARPRVQARNALWCAWLRRPLPTAAAATAALARSALRDHSARGALREALAGLAWAARRRAPVGAALEAELRLLSAVREPAK